MYFTGAALRCTIAFLAVLTVCLPAWAAPITITLAPVSSTVELNGMNDPLTMAIQISNPDRLVIKSWAFDLSYDPGVFQPIVGIGTVPTQGFEVGTYIPNVMGNYNPWYESNGIAPDKARAGVLNFMSTSGNAATGVLGKLALDPISLSGGTILSLSGEMILSTGQSASGVVFQAAQVSVILPEPACMVLMLAGCAALVRRKARGSNASSDIHR
ncbi:MAG TPA: hypothetical protein VLM89_05750 [Phycisphaerae bacterium]|nr:hypothetical protein [Phycisphaerae bacterium]